MNSKAKRPKGFTLTEMLVVVMVVAVLAAISYPLYTKAATKSRAIEAINLLEMVRNKQLSKYAHDKSYYTTASGLGQLTNNPNQETLSGQVLQIKDYTISLNSVKNCATATYTKGSTNFSFSSGYETAGLGCTGDICTSFGNILGTAQDVCNCGSKTCSGGYTLNDTTCNCDCNLGCEAGGSCFAPYGGGSNRPCSSGCGTETSSSTCGGAVWSGSCWSPTQTQPTTQSCGNSGTQTRTCTPSCGGGTCGGWGACTGQTCPTSTKPSTSQSCGNCGTQSRTVTCDSNTGNWTTGSWGTCGGQGVCATGATQTCNGTGTQTCSSSCAWGNCSVINCDTATKPAATQACGNCNTGTQTRTVTCNTSTGTWTTGTWSTCTGGGACAAGATQTCNGTGTQTCSSSCVWGTCSVNNCDQATKPATSQACGNCNTGSQTRTVTCNTSTGTWTTGTWSTCTGGGTCAPGATQTCNTTGTQTCSSSCAWGTCSVIDCNPATKPTATQACGNCNTGTQTRSVDCEKATGTWLTTAWGTCTGGGTCAPGATQACNGTGTQTCSSTCSWGSCSVLTCDPATKPASSEPCGNCGTQSYIVTCNTTTGQWQRTAQSTCTGQGVCAVGATQACGNCNTGTKTCSSSCQWGTCTGGGVCAPGATQNCSGGTQTCSSSCSWGTCVQTVTPVTKTTKVLTTCGAVSGGTCLSYTYELCQPGSGSWSWPAGYNPDDCRSRTTQSVCYDDYIQGSADQFSCQTWSLPSCSGSNYQSLCNANGKGYKCKISASGGTGNAATACMCDWYNGGYSGSYCDQASGLSCVTIYFGGEGTGSYLSCE